MEHNKTFHKIAYCAFSLVIVILVGVVIYQQHMIKRTSKSAEPESLEQVKPQTNLGTSAKEPGETGEVKKPDATAMKEVDELKYHLKAAEEERDMAQNQLSEKVKMRDM
jgi:hypothetical protein